jgi:hypothetical protein
MNNYPNDVKEKLKNYAFLDNLDILKEGIHLKYLNKNNPYKVRGGYFRKMHKGKIMELHQGKRKWYIYYEQNHCYYQVEEEIKEKNPFKRFLKNLVKNNFSF